MFSSKKEDWGTPQSLFDQLHQEFRFGFDLAASEGNKKCQYYFSEQDDALKQDWTQTYMNHGTLFCNPPYGRGLEKWLEKAFDAFVHDDVVSVWLLPARTDTKWFHKYCVGNATVRFLKGRLTFEGAPAPAPFPSMVVVYQPPKMVAGPHEWASLSEWKFQ
jgi:phage N-6-adenine-methyltransferase